MPHTPVADYLSELYTVSGVGVPETSGHPAFESTPQVRDYLVHYGQILLTNYRAFALWTWKDGKAVPGERYSIAASEAEFWDKVHTLRQDPRHPEHERLWQFLRRALLSTARIATPQDLARYLASYAREIMFPRLRHISPSLCSVAAWWLLKSVLLNHS